MTGRNLTIDVVELNPYAPRPFAFTEVALCLRDSLRLAGLQSDHRVNIANPPSSVRGHASLGRSQYSSTPFSSGSRRKTQHPVPI